MSNVGPAPIARARANRQDTGKAGSVDWSSAVAQPAFRELLRVKWRVIAPMLAIYSVFFSGLMLLAGFARPLMAAVIWGPLRPAVHGPGAAFPIVNPAILSVPIGFIGALIGTFLVPRQPRDDAHFDKVLFQAHTGRRID